MFLNNNNAVIQSSYILCIKQNEIIYFSPNLRLNYLILFMLLLTYLTYLFAFNHLNNGGAKESRTPDLLRARQALYQLSYGPM